MGKILFLQRDSYETFGVMYLSACIAQSGHHAEVLIEAEEGRNFFPKIAEAKPDAVGFSLMSGLHTWAAKIAAHVKHRFGYHIIAGGPHCTFFPEFIENEGIDAICRGEGEDALSRYLSALGDKKEISELAGWWIKTERGIIKNESCLLREDLDTLPFPDRDIYRNRYPSLVTNTCCEVLVARGCPYNCSFCYNQFMKDLYAGKGNYLRRHSAQRVIDEINAVRKKHTNGLRWVSFVDDLFIMDRRWLKGFLALYKAHIALPFGCGLRVDLINEELVRMLAEAGCKVASFGIESGDEQLRNGVLNKNITDTQIIASGALLNKYGIRFSAFNMFNIPGEDLERAKKTISLNLKIRQGNYPWSGLLQPYRGTQVYSVAENLGMMSKTEPGADLFNKASLWQKDTLKLIQLNAYFYWMIRYPWLEKTLLFFVTHPVKICSKISLILVSFHRYISLLSPFEGGGAVCIAFKNGLRRIRAYV